MLAQQDLMQPATPSVAHLSALLAHPDFRLELEIGQETFLEEYLPGPLTEEEMIEEVEQSLSRRAIVDEKALFNGETESLFYLLGFVVGTIDKGLTYGTGSCKQEQEALPCESR